MRNTRIFLLILLFTGTWLTAQVKIGDNPQNINPASVLELESTDKVLVITRVTTAQMNAIVPIQGALCYNTEVQAVHYYDGTQWVNIGNGGTGSGAILTADPIVNMPQSTIVITPTADGSNLEIAPESITSEQIRDGGINGTKIQDGSINTNQLVDNAITREKILDNQVGLNELANDEIDLSDFNNATGFLRAADIISGDGGNVITAGGDGGVFYDDSMLMTDIQNNTDAINNLGTPSLNEVLTENNNALDVKIVGLGAPTDPADAATKAYVDAQVAGGGSDDQNIGPVTFDDTTNELSIGIEGGNAGTVDLSALAGGAGSTEVVDGTTLTGAGTVGDPFKIEPSATVGQYLRTTAAGVVWDDVMGGTGTTEVIDDVTLEGLGSAADPFRVKPGAANQILRTSADGLSVAWVDLPTGGAVISDATLTGDGSSAVTALGLADDAVTTVKILDANVTDAKIAPGAADQILRTAADGLTVNWVDLPTGGAVISDATLTGDGSSAATALGITPAPALPTPAAQMLITTEAGDIDWAQISGTENSIFYAGPDGLPITVEENANPRDDRGFYWDPNGRDLGGTFQFGALYLGLEPGNAQSNAAKVHIADNFPGLTYSLHLQNFNDFSTARTTGILFSTADDGAYGKGSLIFDTQGTNGVGDFHFLQNNALNTNLPTATDKAFSIKNNKDIVIYGGIEIDGLGTGTNGQVLTSTGAGVQWTTGSTGADDQDATEVDLATPFDIDGDTNDETTVEQAIIALNATSSDDQNASEVDLVTPIDIDGDTTDETTVEQAIAALAAASGGENLSNTNLAQPAATLVRTYEITNANQSLVFTGAGNVGIGNTANPPSNKLHVGGAIRSEGILNSPGTADTPAYRFNGDTNTGIYWSAADELGFAAGGTTPLLVKQTAADGQEVISNGSLELKEQLLDKDGEEGNAGQILSSTGLATDWIDTPDGAVAKGKINAASGTNGGYTIPVAGQTTNTYIINVAVTENTPGNPIMIQVVSQTNTDFSVQIYEFIGGVPTPSNADWFYTIYNP